MGAPGFHGHGRGEPEIRQRGFRPPTLCGRRVTHDEPPADPNQSAADLGRDRRPGEAPGRHEIEGLPVLGIAGPVLGATLEHLHPVAEVQRLHP